MRQPRDTPKMALARPKPGSVVLFPKILVRRGCPSPSHNFLRTRPGLQRHQAILRDQRDRTRFSASTCSMAAWALSNTFQPYQCPHNSAEFVWNVGNVVRRQTLGARSFLLPRHPQMSNLSGVLLFLKIPQTRYVLSYGVKEKTVAQRFAVAGSDTSLVQPLLDFPSAGQSGSSDHQE